MEVALPNSNWFLSTDRVGVSVAYVANARADSSSRNVYRHADLRDAVEMTKLREHFIFTIESVGVVEARKLFVDAADIMSEKVSCLRSQLEEMLSLA